MSDALGDADTDSENALAEADLAAFIELKTPLAMKAKAELLCALSMLDRLTC